MHKQQQPPNTKDIWILRKYEVVVGQIVADEFSQLDGVIEVDEYFDGEDKPRKGYVQVLESFPITLSYPTAKALTKPPESDEVLLEACDRAVKVYQRRHPNQSFPGLVALDPKFIRERQIENTLVKP